MEILAHTLLGLTGAGVGLTTLEVVAAWLHLQRRKTFPEGAAHASHPSSSIPFVSILKPLCGLEDGISENLARFATLDPRRFEVILSIADPADPVLAVVDPICRLFPRGPFRTVIGGQERGIANPKIARLIAAASVARGEILYISDAQVRLETGDIEKTIDLLRDRSIGCVSNLFIGEGARDFGALIESVHLLTFVAAGNALAAMARVPCLVGKSMAVTRTALNRIGGFEAFSDVLAEDQAMALAMKKAGYRIALSRIVVRNYVERKPLKSSLARQIRWNKIRYSFSKTAYCSEFLINPVPWALSALALTALAGTSPLIAAGALITASAVRMGQTLFLGRLMGAKNLMPLALATPLQDLLQFYAQWIPFLSNEVNWRGHRARLGPGTLILPIAEPKQAA